MDPASGKITGYKTEIGGADSVIPFKGETAVVTFTTSYNSGQNNSGYFSVTHTFKTGLKREEIIHVVPTITSTLATSCNAVVDSIADNGDITVTYVGGGDVWFSVNVVTIHVILYKYPDETIREFTRSGTVGSSAFSGYAYASAADKSKTTHWLPANTDANPKMTFTFVDPFVLKRVDALFCNSSGNVVDGVNVTIYGSNDNKVFEPIQTFEDISLKSFPNVSTDPLESYEINNDKSYKYYRIEFNKALAGITEAEFFGTLW